MHIIELNLEPFFLMVLSRYSEENTVVTRVLNNKVKFSINNIQQTSRVTTAQLGLNE